MKEQTVQTLLDEVDEWSKLLTPPKDREAAAIELESHASPSSAKDAHPILKDQNQHPQQQLRSKPQDVESYYSALRNTLDDMFRAEKKRKMEQDELRQQKLAQYRNRLQLGNSYSTQYGALPYGKFARNPVTTLKSDYLIPSGGR